MIVRESKKKEQIRVVGRKTSNERFPFMPDKIPTNCPVCGDKAWSTLKEGIFITRCLKGCVNVKDHVITTDPVKIKQK